MIEVTLGHLLWILVLGPLALIGLLAAFIGPFRAGKGSVHLANIYRCDHCRMVYVDERKVPICRCPRCRRLNESLRR